MKRLALFVLSAAAVLLVACPAANPPKPEGTPTAGGGGPVPDVSIELVFKYREQSLDSHSTTTSYRVSGKKVTRRRDHSGYRPSGGDKEKPEKKAKLSDEQIRELAAVIEKSLTADYTKAYSESAPVANFNRSESARGVVTLNGKTATVKVSTSTSPEPGAVDGEWNDDEKYRALGRLRGQLNSALDPD